MSGWKPAPRKSHGLRVIDDGQSVACDKQRAGTPNHKHGVPALALVTPYKFTNWPTVPGAVRQLTCGRAIVSIDLHET